MIDEARPARSIEAAHRRGPGEAGVRVGSRRKRRLRLIRAEMGTITHPRGCAAKPT